MRLLGHLGLYQYVWKTNFTKAAKPFTYIVEFTRFHYQFLIAIFRSCTTQLMRVDPEAVGLGGWTQPLVTSPKANLQSKALTFFCVVPAVSRQSLQTKFSHSTLLWPLWERGDYNLHACRSPAVHRQSRAFFERDLCSIHPHCSHQYHRLVSHTLSAIVGFSTCPVQTLCPSALPHSLHLALSFPLSLSRSVSLAHALSLRENSSQLSEGERASVTEVES